jgi:glycosyltransferase involved in cell wall biosynthesis
MQLAQVVGLTGFANDPATAIRGLDIVVHASTAPEPFGLVVAEAMASGRAVVASSGGGVAELVSNDQDGLTYAQGDASALTRQIERLLLDASLRRRLGAAARLRAQAQFSPERARGEILSLYQQFEKVAAA